MVRIMNLRKQAAIRELNPKDINKLISIKGIVIRCSDIQPEMKDAIFECSVCNHMVGTMLDKGIITEPDICDNC